jgi:hypothetical protein
MLIIDALSFAFDGRFSMRLFIRLASYVLLLLAAGDADAQINFNPFTLFGTSFDGVSAWIAPVGLNHHDINTKGIFGNTKTSTRYGMELLLGPYSS